MTNPGLQCLHTAEVSSRLCCMSVLVSFVKLFHVVFLLGVQTEREVLSKPWLVVRGREQTKPSVKLLPKIDIPPLTFQVSSVKVDKSFSVKHQKVNFVLAAQATVYGLSHIFFLFFNPSFSSSLIDMIYSTLSV